MPCIRLYGLFFLFNLVLCQGASAQVPDTTRAEPSDSLQVEASDSLAIRPRPPADSLSAALEVIEPVSFLSVEPGIALGDTLPARHPALDPIGILAEAPGSFVYDFGIAGWPDGWSPFGLSPASVSLSFNGVPFDNTMLGRPNFELLPLPLLQSFRVSPARFGQPMVVNTRLRSYDALRPQTHMRYRSSSNGLSSIVVIHSQQRRINLGRRPGIFAFALGYGGHGANGEYAGSKLEAGRQLLARLRYSNSWGSFELLNLQNRRRLGAHAGVIPFGTDFNSIYNRFNAQVENSSAFRQDIRNDLVLTARSHLIPGAADPLNITGYWTAQTFRYVNTDTLQARTSRFGYRASQSFAFEPARLTANLEGWTEGLRDDSTALADSPLASRLHTHASLAGSLQWGSVEMQIEPGWFNWPGESFAGGRLRLERNTDRLSVYAEASYSGRRPSWAEEYGWGSTLQPLSGNASTRIALIHTGIHVSAGPFDVGITAFTHRSEEAVDYFTTAQPDTVQVFSLGSPVRWSGVTAEFGFRRHRQRGIYLSLTPTFYQFDNPDASAEHLILSRSLPEMYIRGRLGLRYVLFRGDLDMDLYGRGRLWSPFLSRTLHPETGLLVLRRDDAREVEASAALDVVLEAGVRTAKIFVAFENLLSGTTLVPGNMLVPNYPLPARRFRFGVFWPIQD